jgi:hypothetical protein
VRACIATGSTSRARPPQLNGSEERAHRRIALLRSIMRVAKADDLIYATGLTMTSIPPIRPSALTPPIAMDATDPTTNRLPPPPERATFDSQDEFEEARGRWQETVGRIRSMVAQQNRSAQK